MVNEFVKFSIEYYAYLVISTVVNTLPRRTAFALGRTLGNLARRLLTSRTRTARKNLKLAFPERSSTEIEQLLKEHFQHLGVSIIELLRLAKLQPGMPFEAKVVIVGEEHLDEALNLGKGAIFMTAHLGFWELQSILIPNSGHPLDFVARKLKNPRLSQLLAESRSKHGCSFIDRHRGARKIVKSLMNNRLVAIALDQHTAPKEAIKVNFFNRACWATPIITQIAMKRGIPIVANFCTRTADDDYVSEIQKPIILEGNSNNPEDVLANTQLLTDIVEEAVRRNIPQWFWVHNRWRVKD